MKIGKIKFNAAQIVVIGFAGIILIGAFLLWLPISTASGENTSFIDALFTATTSVCVTGLVTVTTAFHWSTFGQIVIIILMQLGGLGVVACVVLSFVVLGRKITIKSRRLIQETYNLDHMQGVVRMILNIVIGTLIVEFIGIVLYAIQFVPEFGLLDGLHKAFFNGVSAFCNAGMDILGDESLGQYVANPLINFTTMGLIIFGGIGFTVWWDFARVFRLVKKREIPWSQFFTKLELHSKLALSITAILILGGAILIFLFELNNSKSMSGLNIAEKFMAALFQSVTTRTAGFATIPQQNLTDASAGLSVLLMFIGGSPMGTAGGMKTTTIGILILVVFAFTRGKQDTEIFGRKIMDDNIRTALVVVVIGFFILVLSIGFMCVFTQFDFLDILYECTSAIGTVGLTRGITPSLPIVGKVIIILTMFAGRIGPITLAMAITMKAKKETGQVHLPERKILIG